MPEAFTTIFNQYGLYFFIGLFLVNVIVVIWVFVIQKKIKNIFRGESQSLEKVLLELRDNQDLSYKEVSAVQSRVSQLEGALPHGIRRVGLVRHNPFSDSGGDQSFALALLNENKDGIVISSLYGRSINRVYAKSIVDGISKHQLSEEERKAIENAFV